MRLNLSAVKEDVRKIGLALFLAVMINTMINDGLFLDNVWGIIFSVITWLAGIIEFSTYKLGGKQ